jgi:hypothetical protein
MEIQMACVRCQKLNDEFRRTLNGGKVVVTSGVRALPPSVTAQAMAKMRAFNKFTRDNDPSGEHDFGSFKVAGLKFFWRIEAFDRAFRYASEDPTDSEQTTRVLTLMLASEY